MRMTGYESDGSAALIETARDAANELASALAGTTLPRDALPGYRILREIHRGGQGVVYRAVRLATGREVAVKIMRDGPFSGPRDVARFEREVQVLAQLSHPNIVGIHDRGSAGGCHYFVMDYVAGQALDAYIDQRQPPISERLKLFLKIGRAVNAAHLRGVIHRDLKPSNVRIDADGEPHVLDFGLAKIAMEETEEAAVGRQMTLTGQFVGTLPWASPEQAEGPAERVDLRSDVYSLGVMLYYMLTGAFPYPVAGNPRKVLWHILESEPIRLRTFGNAIDEDVETIVLKCLAKEPERRYQSVAAVIEDIERYMNRQPILARAPSTMYQFNRLVKRHPWPVALVASLLIVVIGFSVWMGVLYTRAASSRDRAQRAEGLAERRRVEAEREAESAKAIKEFLVQDLLSSAKPEVARGQKVTVEEVLARSAERIEHAFKDQPEIEASVRSTLGNVYLTLGLYRDAEAQLLVATRLFEDLRGHGDLETLKVRHAWINAGLSCGPDWPVVEKSEDFLRDCQSALGEAHEITVSAIVRHAEALSIAGRQAEAYQTLSDGLERCRTFHGEDHPLTIALYNQWAQWTLEAAGRRRELETLFRDALQRARDSLGDDHVETHQAMVNLGSVLSHQRRFAEAEPLLRTGYEGLRRALAESNPRLLHAMRNLALYFKEKNLIREAIDLNRKAVSLARHTLGDDNPITLDAVLQLGASLFRGGCFCEAEELMWNCWEACHRTQGEQSGRSAHALELYSNALLNLGRASQAEEGFRRAHLARLETDGVADAWCLRQLIRSLAEQGRSEEAREFGVRLLDLRRNAALRPDADAYGLNSYAYDLLTVMPEDLRDPEEALRIALSAYEQSGDEYHFNRFTLAMAYEVNGQLDEAVVFARRALEACPLEHSTERGDYESLLSRCLERAGDLAEAEQVYRDTLAARRAESPSSDHDVAVSLFDLGSLLVKHGKYAEAESVLREFLEKRQDLLAGSADNDCPLTLNCEIARTKLALGRSLMGLERFSDAESYLLEAFDQLSRSTTCHTACLPESARLLTDLYHRMERPERATPYTTVLSRVVPHTHP